MNKKEVRAESVKMSTVKFRPGIEFKRYVAGKMELERADKRFFPDKPKAMGDMVAREKSMMDFLEANVCITRAEYSRLVHVTARRASRDLQTFIDSGVIRKRWCRPFCDLCQGVNLVYSDARAYIYNVSLSFLPSFPFKKICF